MAYNFFLATEDSTIAQRIARRIRQSSGGLPGIKAIGLLVHGRAQVSVNLVDYRQTPLHTLTEWVERLAQEEGTSFEEAELIGLLPQEVLLQTTAHYLKLPGLVPGRIVESAVNTAARSER